MPPKALYTVEFSRDREFCSNYMSFRIIGVWLSLIKSDGTEDFVRIIWVRITWVQLYFFYHPLKVFISFISKKRKKKKKLLSLWDKFLFHRFDSHVTSLTSEAGWTGLSGLGLTIFLFKRIFTKFLSLHVTAISINPSWSKSPTTIPWGCSSTTWAIGGHVKVPSPLPRETVIESSVGLDTAKSALLSPVKSATTTNFGKDPEAKSCNAENDLSLLFLIKVIAEFLISCFLHQVLYIYF